MNKLFTTLLLSIVSTSVFGQNTYVYQQPKALNDGWQTDHLKSQDIDTSLFYLFFNQLTGQKHKLHSALLIKDGVLVLEEYFNNQQANIPHDLRSTSKSIRSLLVGIAIDKGFIDDVNDPISKYLKQPVPEKNLDSRKEQITIRHLLTMSSGLDCNDWDRKSKGQEDKVYRKRDWLQYTIDLPMVNEPGKVANYCSLGTVLLAEIVSQASGMSIDKFAAKYLFDPLGISNVQWGHTSNKKVIPSAKRLYMISRDMAKIGQLILNHGKWNGTQIVSESWVAASTTYQTKLAGLDYGYLWWNIPIKVKEEVLITRTATGNGGQYIIVVPEKNFVAVFTGGAYNSAEDKLPFAILKDVILPSFK